MGHASAVIVCDSSCTILQVARWCKENEIGLVLVGPEAPLVAGLVDTLKRGGIRQDAHCAPKDSDMHKPPFRSRDIFTSTSQLRN